MDYPNVEIPYRQHVEKNLTFPHQFISKRKAVVLSFIRKTPFYIASCFKKNQVSKVNKLDEEQRQQQMRVAIHEITESVAGRVRHLVPTSPSARAVLKNGDKDRGNSLNQTENEATLDKIRRDMMESFKKSIHDYGWDRETAVVHTHTEYALQVLKTGIGNCAEMAMLAAILLNATLKTELIQRGFSLDEITKADIEVSIWELAERDQIGKDHTICLLSYYMGEEEQLFVDPWLNGSVYDPKDADYYYQQHVNNVKEPLELVRSHKDKALAAADEHCASAVLLQIEKQYGIEHSSLIGWGA